MTLRVGTPVAFISQTRKRRLREGKHLAQSCRAAQKYGGDWNSELFNSSSAQANVGENMGLPESRFPSCMSVVLEVGGVPPPVPCVEALTFRVMLCGDGASWE